MSPARPESLRRSTLVFAGVASAYRFAHAYLRIDTDAVYLKYKGPEKKVPLQDVSKVHEGAGGNTAIETYGGERVLIPGFFGRRNEFVALIAYR